LLNRHFAGLENKVTVSERPILNLKINNKEAKMGRPQISSANRKSKLGLSKFVRFAELPQM
jgi:hypothetical protein